MLDWLEEFSTRLETAMYRPSLLLDASCPLAYILFIGCSSDTVGCFVPSGGRWERLVPDEPGSEGINLFPDQVDTGLTMIIPFIYSI